MHLTHHADLEPVVPGDELVSVSLSPYGDLVALWTAAADVDALLARSGGGTFAKSRTPRPVSIRVTTHGGLLLQVREFELAHPTAHLMPGDTVLTVGARARAGWRNAIHYDHDGAVLTTAALGDAIMHVATTRAGEIWVGYFDEGAFDAPAGLVRFGPDLRLRWAFDWDQIVDCYALNVTDHAVLACYYTDFPLVRIENDRVTGWRNSVAGVHALAAAGNTAGLLGDYDDHDRLVLGTLYDDEFHVTGEHRVTLPDGSPLPRDARVIGQGHELHFVVGHAWYRMEI